ncbi:MAG: hypothetical protein AUG75_12365, partial [Cyanobacteria bacterium 13_1_20CM_4_61_6]
ASPTIGSNAGDDIYNSSGSATIVATRAAQAPSPCVPAASPIFFVNASSVGPNAGSDANPGTRSLPFKTITFAMTQATSAATVRVLPGIYDTLNNGETFPITVPAGVLLIADDETPKGSGTSIVGGAQVPTFRAGTSAAVHPGTGSTIAGFTITNDNPDPALARYGLFLSNSAVTLRNNTVTGASHAIGVYVADDGGAPPTPSKNHVITGNRIVDNAPGAGTGLAFVSGGDGSKVEDNVITGNGFGVEYDVAGGDLGSSLQGGSAGRNTISSNAMVDLLVTAPIAICARNNSWDNSPPTSLAASACLFSGEDICDFSGAASIDTGAMPRPNPNLCGL